MALKALSSKEGGPSPVAATIDQPERHTVPPEPRYHGNGYPVFAEAIKKTPKASVAAKRDLVGLLLQPNAQLSTEGLRFAKDAWPAIKELEHAICSESFARVGSDGGVGLDLEKTQFLCVAALTVARVQSATRAAPGVGRWAVRTLRLGHELAKDAPLIDSIGALAVARVGERWLKAALEERPWSEDEILWLRGELDKVASKSTSLEAPRDTGKASDAWKKVVAAEREAFEEVRRLAHEKTKRTGRS